MRKGNENLLADEGYRREEPRTVNMPERNDRTRIADSVHKTSILERLKEQKQQEQTSRKHRQKPERRNMNRSYKGYPVRVTIALAGIFLWRI